MKWVYLKILSFLFQWLQLFYFKFKFVGALFSVSCFKETKSILAMTLRQKSRNKVVDIIKQPKNLRIQEEITWEQKRLELL